jgi:hypothetical protein
MGNARIPQKLQPWVEARKRFHLSHAHIQMARDLGLNPKKLGKIANHKQEPWKAPLPVFLEELYEKRFGRRRPEKVLPVEELAQQRRLKKQASREESRKTTESASESGAQRTP